MDREEFERIKQAEKEHLRKLKQIKGQLRDAQRTARLRQAFEEIKGTLDPSEFDTSLETVQREALESEARLDVALEQAEAADTPDLSPALTEEEARKAAAAALVAEMKASLNPGAAPAEDATRAASDEDLPEKTIGRLKPPGAKAEEDVPKKTIGRSGRNRRSTNPSDDEAR